MNLQDIAISKKSRKGPAHKITSDGAYWLAIDIKIDANGGDGIGQSAASSKDYFRVRHYRDGSIRAYCERESWHQNSGDSTNRVRCDAALACETIEDLIRTIKGVPMDREYSDCGHSDVYYDISGELPELPSSLPSPDDIPAKSQ